MMVDDKIEGVANTTSENLIDSAKKKLDNARHFPSADKLIELAGAYVDVEFEFWKASVFEKRENATLDEA